MEEEFLGLSGLIGDHLDLRRNTWNNQKVNAFTVTPTKQRAYVTPTKPRAHGMTEIQGPYHSVTGSQDLQDVFESIGDYIDGLRFAGGCYSLMPRGDVKQFTSLAHDHGVYVSTGGWAEHVLHKGPRSFKQYVQDCKDLGFDTVELNNDFLHLDEDNLLQLIRTIKNAGLHAKPELGLPFLGGENAELATIGRVDPKWVINRAERYLQAGADIIHINSDGITDNLSDWHADLVSKIIERLGLEKIMFEANDTRMFEWFINNYGPKVNLFVDHSQIVQLERERSGFLGPRYTRSYSW